MRADLATLSPQTHPGAFVNAAVLSPDDPAMDTSDAAAALLQAERMRLVAARYRLDYANDRLLRVEKAMKNIRKLRKAKRNS